MDEEKIKRINFIKKFAPKKLEDAIKTGKFVPSADEMNEVFKIKKRR